MPPLDPALRPDAPGWAAEEEGTQPPKRSPRQTTTTPAPARAAFQTWETMPVTPGKMSMRKTPTKETTKRRPAAPEPAAAAIGGGPSRHRRSRGPQGRRGLRGRLRQLNCAAPSAAAAAGRVQGGDGTNHNGARVDEDVRVQHRKASAAADAVATAGPNGWDWDPRRTPARTRIPKKTRMPPIAEIPEQRSDVETQERGSDNDGNDDNSDDYFTDDESSTSSGLQMNTMDADSWSTDSEDREPLGDDRIGIRPFEVPGASSGGSSVLSPPILSMSHSSLAADEQQAVDNNPFATSHATAKPENRFENELRAIREALKKHTHEEPQNEKDLTRELADQFDITSNREELQLDQAMSADAVLKPREVSHVPPTYVGNRVHATLIRLKERRSSILQHSNISFRHDLRTEIPQMLNKSRLYGSDGSMEEPPQQLPLLFHGGSNVSHGFRSTSPGVEPVRQLFHSSYTVRYSSPKIEALAQKYASLALRRVSPPLAASPAQIGSLRHNGTADHCSSVPGSTYNQQSSIQDTISVRSTAYSILGDPASKSNDRVGHPIPNQKVRWSSTLHCSSNGDCAAESSVVPEGWKCLHHTHVSEDLLTVTLVPRHLTTSTDDCSLVTEVCKEMDQDMSLGDDRGSLALPPRRSMDSVSTAMTKDAFWLTETSSLPGSGTCIKKSSNDASSSITPVDEFAVSEQSDTSGSSVKDLISKFNSGAKQLV